MATKQLSDASGVVIGQSATDTVGFYGVTAVAKQACTLSEALTAGSTVPADIAAAFKEVYSALIDLGLISAA